MIQTINILLYTFGSNGLCTKQTMNIFLYRLAPMGYLQNKLSTFCHIDWQLWVIHKPNYEHFVIQTGSNGLYTKQTMKNLFYRLIAMSYPRNKLLTFWYIEWQLWFIQETNFEHIYIQIDNNGLYTKQAMNDFYID